MSEWTSLKRRFFSPLGAGVGTRDRGEHHAWLNNGRISTHFFPAHAARAILRRVFVPNKCVRASEQGWRRPWSWRPPPPPPPVCGGVIDPSETTAFRQMEGEEDAEGEICNAREQRIARLLLSV